MAAQSLPLGDNRFQRMFLPLGIFQTAKNGNLEHIMTGDQDFQKFLIKELNE